MTTHQLRVGLVGAGNIAQIAQLPSLAGRDDVTIAGIVTRTEPSAVRNLAKWPIERSYPTVDDMLEEANLDAVFVLTPRLDHADYVEAALVAGVDVFCEKPLAPTAVQAHRLADLSDKYDRILQVGFNRRYAEVYATGRAQFGDGYADICVAQKNRAGSEYRATFENAIHMVDLLRWYCGEPADVSAHAIAEDRYQEDGLAALIRFKTGAVGTLIAARTAGIWDERLDAYGDNTSVRVVSPENLAIDRDGETRLIEMRPRSYGWVEATNTLGFRQCVEHFLDRIRDRTQPLTNGRDAAKTQDLLDKILEAADLPTDEESGRQWESHAVE